LGRKAGERVDIPSEQDARGLIEKGIADEVREDLLTPAIMKSMENAFGQFTKALDAILEAKLKEFANVRTHSRKNAVPKMFGDGENGDINKSFGAFLLAVRLGDQKALEQMGAKFVDWENVGQKATLVTQVGELGGYAVPTEHYGRIYQVVYN